MTQSFVLKKSDGKMKQPLIMKPPVTIMKKDLQQSNPPILKNQMPPLPQPNFDLKPKRSLVIPRGNSQEKPKEQVRQKITMRGLTPKVADLQNNNSSAVHFRKRVASAREKYEENIQ